MALLRLKRKLKGLADEPGKALVRSVFRVKRMLGRNGHLVFIASVPKCASTFLLNSLVAVTDFPSTQLCYGHGHQEQDLYFPRLVDAYGRNILSRLHTRATSANVELMKTFGIRPVIVVRNFLDVVPSIREHLYQRDFYFPFLHSNETFRELDEAAQLDCIIEMAIPWYFNFYVSWYDTCARGEVDALWITFDEMVADWSGTLRKILEFHGLEKSDGEIERALEHTRGLGKDRNKQNEGKVGRGKVLLSEGQRQRVLEMARFYPWVDFSRVGIPARNA
jgi:Sulfotransferase domain